MRLSIHSRYLKGILICTVLLLAPFTQATSPDPQISIVGEPTYAAKDFDLKIAHKN